MKIKKFNENKDIFEEDWEEIDDEKVKLISEIMEIEYNDPLFIKVMDQTTEEAKNFVKKLRERIGKDLDNIGIKDLKIVKKLCEMEHEKRKYIADNYESVEIVNKLIIDIIKDMGESNELD